VDIPTLNTQIDHVLNQSQSDVLHLDILHSEGNIPIDVKDMLLSDVLDELAIEDLGDKLFIEEKEDNEDDSDGDSDFFEVDEELDETSHPEKDNNNNEQEFDYRDIRCMLVLLSALYKPLMLMPGCSSISVCPRCCQPCDT